MSILYLDCGMGASGDMLSGALLELIPNKDEFVLELNKLGIPDVSIVSEDSKKCGICGTHISVKIHNEEEFEHIHKHNHEHVHVHHHTGMHEIEHIVEDLPLSKKLKKDILAVYSLIAEAESHIHGVPVNAIHFHEVGMMDAVADITAVCILMDKINPKQVIVSPVNVGSGTVKCAHGVLPVPAPATAYILKDVPIYSGEIKSELCTPTGAALLKYFASKFGNMPIMNVSKIGYGMGKKDFTTANCVRAFLGEEDRQTDTIVELTCNLDDMTAEAIGFAEEQILSSGALDVYTIPVQMKKSRPGHIFSVICYEKDKEKIVKMIFSHTTTLGVRESVCNRYTLSRSTETISTEYGEVRVKVSQGYGVKKEKCEYEDIARIAKENGMSFVDVLKLINGKINGK